MDKMWGGLGLLALLALGIASGCAGKTIRTDVSMSWPRMWLDEAEGKALVVMEAPSPGWRLEFDHSEKAPRGTRRVLLSARRPDPAFFYPQMVVEQHVITDVDAGMKIEVFARVIDHDAKHPDTPYDRVTLAPGE
ncbi:MAG: hypothetical protein R3B57_02750 [Phycisphaerales bacterium]